MSGSKSFRLSVSMKNDIEKAVGVQAVIPIAQNTVEANESKVGNRPVGGINCKE